MDTRYNEDEKARELDEKARELIKWLNDHGHPHMSITIHPTGYELKEHVIGSGQIMDYVVD